jgi:flagellin
MVINTNVAATVSANNLDQSTEMLNKSLARLSSGSKIVDASDDPAGLAESVGLVAEIGETNAANSNVSNAVSFLQTQDGYLQQVGSALDQMAMLATEAQDVTKTTGITGQTENYQTEFSALAAYIGSVANQTFNGVDLFHGGTMNVTTDGNGGTYQITNPDLTQAVYAADLTGSNVANDATDALTAVNNAIAQLASDRGGVGASEDRLSFTASALSTLSSNLTAANSQITDVDVASESTNYAKYQILVQSGTAMLAQANQNPQSILKLLQ